MNTIINSACAPSKSSLSTTPTSDIKEDKHQAPFAHNTSKRPRPDIKPGYLHNNKVDPLSKPIDTLLPQDSIPEIPSARPRSLMGGQLSGRSASLRPAPPLNLTTLPKPSISEEQRRLLSCYLQVPIDIYDHREFNRFTAYGSGMNLPWIIRHTHTNILESAISVELIKKCDLAVDDLPEALITPKLALMSLNHCYGWHYEALPARLKTPEFNQLCLERGVLPKSLEPESSLPLPIDYFALINIDANNIKYVPLEHQSLKLCFKALKNDPKSIRHINPSVSFHQQLCVLSVKANKRAYSWIPKDRITKRIYTMAKACHGAVALNNTPEHLVTYQHCRQILYQGNSYRQFQYIPTRIFHQYPELAEHIVELKLPGSPDILEKLPEELKTEDFCRRYLSNWPGDIQGCPLALLRKHPEWLKQSLKYRGYNLNLLPESERSFDLCRRALKSPDCCIEAVPAKMLEKYPELLLIAAGYPKGLSKIPPRLRTLDVCIEALTALDPKYINETMTEIPEAVRKKLPYDLLLAVAPGHLPMGIREAMVTNGDTTLPPQYRQKKPILNQRHLMEPLQQKPFGELTFSSSVFLKRILLSTGPFNLRNQSLGIALEQTITQHCQQQVRALHAERLPLLRSVGKKSTIYGGRTLMFCTGDVFTRMKFLRKGESMDDFCREEAVHRFARGEHNLTTILKSEVPNPVGISLLPIDQLPDNILAGFHSDLERITLSGQTYYLVYEFTTRNEDYSTLAHCKDSNGDSTRAEQGLLNACHDLGVWSSLGAVHTSTINAYHNFKDNRRELFLCHMFDEKRSLPGALTGWDTRATDESDWAYSGLKDLGDMEFYPRITSYFHTKDADALLPDGFGQRVAFMSAFVENMIAPVLHYARMHRDDADYHYQNSEGRAKLGAFIISAIGAYLSGLKGRPAQAVAYFESPQIFATWVNDTTAEVALWTARQNLKKDCFARNLKQTGCYSEQVYPDQKETHYRYPENFTSNNQDNLGCNNGQFGLTLLVRGLYQVAAVLADELGS